MKIIEKQKNEIKKLAKKYQLELVLLFGSQVSGKTHKRCDIDVAVKFIKYDRDINIDLALQGRLNGVFEKDIDLSIINIADPLLLKQINNNSKLLFGKLRDYYKFNIYSFHRYVDYENFLKTKGYASI